jgi:polar amino acid transport system substrate-binding protein
MKPLACLCLLACLAATAAPAAEPRPELRLTANIWEPYTGADLPRQGIASEIVLTALARAGYTAEIGIMPWSRALASVYQGNRDGVVGVWLTAERRARLAVSDSYLSNELFLFYVRPELCTGNGLSADASTRIGVGRDYDYSDAFLARYASALKPVDRVEQNLLKLQAGRVDMVLEDKRVVEFVAARQPGAPLLTCTAQPAMSLPLHFGLRRSYPNADAIIAAFNLQLAAMRKDGTLDAITRRLAHPAK